MMNDHERGCQGREYTCTCGYDDQQEELIRERIATLEAHNRDLMDGRHSDLEKMREMKALIRELVTMIGQALADTERNPLETGFNHRSETTRELAQRLILVRNGLFDALAKAKTQGYET